MSQLGEFINYLVGLRSEEKKLKEIEAQLKAIEEEYKQKISNLVAMQNQTKMKIADRKKLIDEKNFFTVNIGELINSVSKLKNINKQDIKCIVSPRAFYWGREKKTVNELISIAKNNEAKGIHDRTIEIVIYNEAHNGFFFRLIKELDFDEELNDGSRMHQNLETTHEVDEFGRLYTALIFNPKKTEYLNYTFNVDEFLNSNGKNTKLLREAIYKTVLKKNAKSKYSKNENN